MNYLFYFGSHILIESLIRFLKYVLFPDCPEIRDGNYLFWEERDYIDDETLISCSNYLEYRVIPVTYKDYQKKNIVCILDLTDLKENFIKAIDNCNAKNMLYLGSVRQKISLFLKGHGEESLYSVLNSSKYFINNGIQGIINYPEESDDYFKDFIKPGLKAWKEFKERFFKYKDFLRLCGCCEEISTSLHNIERFEMLINLLTDKNRLLRISNKVLAKYLLVIDEIDNCLLNIERKTKEIEK
jgi:hypothetical protein